MGIDPGTRKSLHDEVAEVMKKHRVETRGHTYTKPASGVYDQQWLWDSCFHAIVNLHLDPDESRREIAAALSNQLASGPDAGMVPHMNYFEGGGEALWGTPGHSGITHPPMLAFAVREIARASGKRGGDQGADRDEDLSEDRGEDLGFAHEAFDPLYRYYAWFSRRRDPDGDRLVSIIHPWESGWDNSPRWDELAGFGDDDERNKHIRAQMAARLREMGFDSGRALQDGGFDVEPVDFNCVYAENLAALAWCADRIGRPAEAAALAGWADEVRRAVRQKMRDPGTGSYLDIARVGGAERHVAVKSAAGFFPLFAGIPAPDEARALVDRLTSDPFWPRYPVPTVSLDDPEFSADRYWRGTTWVNVNWFIVRGLVRYGFGDVATELAGRTAELVSAHGLWEYYDPLTGRGLGARDLSMSGLVIDMISMVDQMA